MTNIEKLEMVKDVFHNMDLLMWSPNYEEAISTAESAVDDVINELKKGA